MATDVHSEPEHADGHHEPSDKAYIVIFAALAVFTAVSFIANEGARHDVISRYTSFAIILLVAVVKAVLVAMYFMHLKIDWGRVFVMVVPALILGPMLIIVLLPDIVLAWRNIAPTLVP
jgi:caa(3)-type oxidase subunit IV